MSKSGDANRSNSGNGSANKAPKYEIILFTKMDGPLTKRISLTDDGSVFSDGSACIMSRGTARRVQINSVGHLATQINSLNSKQAIALGTLFDQFARRGRNYHQGKVVERCCSAERNCPNR
jgi:hypothetical protein